MKRFGLLVAAVLMGATSVFAKNDVSTKEPFAASMYQLANYLDLTAAQVDEVSSINEYFIQKQKESLHSAASMQEKKMQEAIYGNLKLMKKVLTEEQYRKYVMLLNITNNNNRRMNVESVNDVYLAENK
jgi:hypothetical protein